MAWLGTPRTARIYRAQNSRDLDTNKTPILRVYCLQAKTQSSHRMQREESGESQFLGSLWRAREAWSDGCQTTQERIVG